MARKTSIVFIIIGVIVAVYFTARQYALINKIEEQEFFVKDTGEIERDIEIMEGRNDRSTEYLFNLGTLYAKKKDFKKAKGYFIEIVKRDPHHGGALNNLGNIAALEGNFGRARSFFHKAQGAEPENADYLVNFAYACFKVNVMEEAMETLEEALKLDPGHKRAILLKRQMKQ